MNGAGMAPCDETIDRIIRTAMAKRKHSRGPARPKSRPARAGGGGSAILLYGVHASLAALANPARRCRRVLLTPEAERRLGDQIHALIDHRRSPIELDTVERADLERRLPQGAVHQ